MQNTATGEMVALNAAWLRELPKTEFKDPLEELAEKSRLLQAAKDEAIPNREHQGAVFQIGEILEIKGGKFRVNGFSRKRLYLDSLPFK